MKHWEHFNPSKNYGECPAIDLTDDERMKANDMRRELTKRIVSTMSDKDRKLYLKECRKISTIRRNRKKNPIKCKECIIEDTCVKRLKHSLYCCPEGVKK